MIEHPRQSEAELLGCALMRGNRAEHKTGYTYENACLAAAERCEMTDLSGIGLTYRLRLLAYLFGFACGMEVIPSPTTNAGRRQGVRAFGKQYLEDFDRGYAAGVDEYLPSLQPAGLSFEED